jgi:hypothetical protein
MIGPRIEPVTCPECGLRARVRARPSDSPESFVNDNISKCFHARNGIAILDCPSLKPQLVRADRALRGGRCKIYRPYQHFGAVVPFPEIRIAGT